jgi:HptB-dependent secretion and biofilm anti anti-sigma factor
VKKTGDDAVAEVCVELSGEYDLNRKHELALIFESLEGDDPIVIDLAKVSYLDSTMLNELSILRSRNQARQITLRGASENIRRILRLVNFDTLFNVTEAES